MEAPHITYDQGFGTEDDEKSMETDTERPSTSPAELTTIKAEPDETEVEMMDASREESVPVVTMKPVIQFGPPGDFSVTRDADGTFQFTWTKPNDVEDDSVVDGYTITVSYYLSCDVPQGKQHRFDYTNGNIYAASIQLDKETSYNFEIRAYAGDYVSRAKRTEIILPKHAFLNQSTKIRGSAMPTYLIPTRDTLTHHEIFRKEVGKPSTSWVVTDGEHIPQFLQAMKQENLPNDEYFKFNNSAIFIDTDQEHEEHDELFGYFNKMFWEIGKKSFKNFLQQVYMTKTECLTLTRDVLDERERIEIHVVDLHKQVKKGLSCFEQLRDEVRILETAEMDIDSSKDYTYKVKKFEMNKNLLTGNQNTTTYLTGDKIWCQRICALHDDPRTLVEIKPGWQGKINGLSDLRQQAQDICDIDMGECDLFKMEEFDLCKNFPEFAYKARKTGRDMKKTSTWLAVFDKLKWEIKSFGKDRKSSENKTKRRRRY